MVQKLNVDLALDDDVHSHLVETSKTGGQTVGEGVSTIVRLWATHGIKNETDNIDSYLAGGKLVHGIIFRQNLAIILMVTAACWYFGKLKELWTIVPYFIASYAIVFIYRKISNVRLEKKMQNPETMLSDLKSKN